VLASSNRGGRRVRKNASRADIPALSSGHLLTEDVSSFTRNNSLEGGTNIALENQINQNLGLSGDISGREGIQEDEMPPTIESAIASTSLHNTTDTLNFLSRSANGPHSYVLRPKSDS
jgi:hypothetical protein